MTDELAKPYIGDQPFGMVSDMVISDALTDDPALWVPLSTTSWSRPLLLNPSLGYYVHLLKVTQGGVLSRHRHSGPVHAYVLKGSWYYLEHDWKAEIGSYIFEPPGETHTLVVPEDCSEMITLFTVFGALIYVDEEGNATGYDDVFTRMELYRNHFQAFGKAGDFVDQFVR